MTIGIIWEVPIDKPIWATVFLRVKESPSHSDFEELQVIGSFQLSGNQGEKKTYSLHGTASSILF